MAHLDVWLISMYPAVVVFGAIMVLVVVGLPVVFFVAQKKGRHAFDRVMRFFFGSYLCWLAAFSTYLLIAGKKIPGGAWATFGIWALVAVIYLIVSPRGEKA